MLRVTPRRPCWSSGSNLLSSSTAFSVFQERTAAPPADLLLAAPNATSNVTTASAVCRSLPSPGHVFSPCYFPLSPLPATTECLSFGFSGTEIPPSGRQTNRTYCLPSLHLWCSPAILVPARRTLRFFSLFPGFTPLSVLRG